ncbi:MAG: hypothetical protein EDX89_08670 [Acidobacteria bacterium]|nr:MAG: hypothetical protein EDX89_08670 [Acidobacteriota bacterium]
MVGHALRAFCAALLAVPAVACSAAAQDELFTKLLVDRDGVVTVTDRELAAAGARFADGEIARLRLTLRGADVPALLRRLPAGSADGRFDLTFVGERPHGEKTWDDPFVRDNVYLLRVSGPGEEPRRLERIRAPRPAPGTPLDASPSTVHLEDNRKLIRFTSPKVPDEVWFWAEVKATDKAATSVPVPLEAVARDGTARLRVRMVGYSHLPESPDHTVDVTWNGEPLGQAEWDGETGHVFEADLPAVKVREGENALGLRALGARTKGIDLVLLDWVEVTYPRKHVVAPGGQTPLTLADGALARFGTPSDLLVFDVERARAYEVPSRGGTALFAAPASGSPKPAAGMRPYLAVAKGGARAPRAVAVSRPADLTAEGLGARYLVVTHPRLRAEAERIARVRAEQGLPSLVVDVEDLYDRFNHGFLHPSAIRDFLAVAARTWKPAPRYVLLMGDASWDYKNATVSDSDYADWHWSPQWPRVMPKNTSNVYGKKDLPNDRQLVPTWQYQSPWGHSASDNYFAAFAGPDKPPDLAVGRIPAATPEEARAAVDKILLYERLSPGELRSALFITNEELAFQRATDSLVSEAERQGYEVRRVYPLPDAPANAESTQALVDAFDAGQAFVLFNGHGGRYIWRTAATDLKKNADLFTLADLDRLAETKGLPVVVSLTCYSAPFDHPIADSIGEKLLRVDGKGAIAVVASSWRNSPPLELGRKLLQLLGGPGHERIGDAFVDAKKAAGDVMTISTYNLLGDPATLYRGPVPGLAKAAAPGPTSPEPNEDGEPNARPDPSR